MNCTCNYRNYCSAQLPMCGGYKCAIVAWASRTEANNGDGRREKKKICLRKKALSLKLAVVSCSFFFFFRIRGKSYHSLYPFALPCKILFTFTVSSYPNIIQHTITQSIIQFLFVLLITFQLNYFNFHLVQISASNTHTHKYNEIIIMMSSGKTHMNECLLLYYNHRRRYELILIIIQVLGNLPMWPAGAVDCLEEIRSFCWLEEFSGAHILLSPTSLRIGTDC